MQALSFDTDVRSLSLPPPRPQASHRHLNRDDMRWGCDPTPPSPPRRRRLAATQKLPTIWEDVRLRCRRVELHDPTPGSSLRFSGVYCPPVYGSSKGLPYILNNEHLENFAVLRPYEGRYVNVTQTMNSNRRSGLYDLARHLYRDAFACGLLY